MLIFYIFLLIIGIFVIGYLVLRFDPAFGGRHSEAKKAVFLQSNHYQNGKFINQVPTTWDTSFGSMVSMVKDFIKASPDRRPKRQIPMVPFTVGSNVLGKEEKVTWFGHSAFLFEIEDKKLLFDPMFGSAPSPFPLFSGKRYSGKVPFEIEDLPMIDAVILSHDHYDHLDYGSILKLKGKVKHYFVPLGVGSHLERWGISSEKISEHDWGDEFSFSGLQLACTPARHFSGRSLNDRDATLWCSWVVQGKNTKLYYSGDGGYGPHFKEIGENYGPFDLTLMECGQYDERWAALHMMPEESVQAHLDVKGKLMIPVHWGAFTLSLHDWHDPVERAMKAAQALGVEIATPRIGETVIVGSKRLPFSKWWKVVEDDFGG